MAPELRKCTPESAHLRVNSISHVKLAAFVTPYLFRSTLLPIFLRQNVSSTIAAKSFFSHSPNIRFRQFES
jgi:hypothetical protein